jgi:TetR/AcrR family transcriptional regulator of autoinduction and epiphytic fitness
MSLRTEKRDRILDAAVSEFQERGFTGASMDRIAERAEVSKRTVYNHFDGKETLFRSIVDLIVEEANDTVNVTYRPGKPIRPQLVDLARAEGRLLRSKTFMRLVRMALGETIRDPALAAEMNACTEKVSVFHDFMQAAGEDGQLRTEDVETATEQFIGLIKSRAFWPYVFSGDTVGANRMEDIVQGAVDVFLSHYGAGGER